MAENQVTQSEMAEQVQEQGNATPLTKNGLRVRERIEKKICVRCQKPVDRDGVRCQACCDFRRNKYKQDAEKGKCTKCGKSTGNPRYRVCAECRKVGKQYTTEWRNKQRESGNCVQCGLPTNNDKFSCNNCLAKDRERWKDRPKRERHCHRCGEVEVPPGVKLCPECARINENQRRVFYRDKAKAEGKCPACHNERDTDKKLCSRCQANVRRRNALIKQRAMAGYGGKCHCCSETRLAFLTLDHINNDGGEQRSSGIGGCGGVAFYRWVIRNNFPPNLICACLNCNIGRRINGGTCPHQDPNYQDIPDRR